MKLSKFKRLEKVVSKDPKREGLTQVYLDAERGRLMAADGRRGVSIPVEVGADDVSGFIPVCALQLGRSGLGKEEFISLNVGSDEVVVPLSSEKTATIDRSFKEDKFPDLEAVIQSVLTGEGTLVEVKLDPTLLVGFAEALGSKDAVRLTFVHWDDEGDHRSAIMVQGCSDSDRGVGILMPLTSK